MDLFSVLRKMKILVVDDDEWIRDSLSLYFENEECSLLALETAEEAIKLLTRESFEIIIVDYRLPGMDGLEFLKHIQESCPCAIKILITAYGTDDVISRAKDFGVVDIINKPFTSDTIEHSLSLLLIKHNQGSVPNAAESGMNN